jgi:hypothetical protein
MQQACFACRSELPEIVAISRNFFLIAAFFFAAKYAGALT